MSGYTLSQLQGGRVLPLHDEAFWARVTTVGDCWIMGGGRTGGGYASFGGTGAHRYSYEMHYGPIPVGVYVCHHCDNPPCVRPDHLFIGTPRDNALDCSAKGRANGSARAHHGEDHGRAKLTWEQVCEIRRRYPHNPGRGGGRNSVGPTMEETASEFGVTSGLISQIVKGSIWQLPRGGKRGDA